MGISSLFLSFKLQGKVLDGEMILKKREMPGGCNILRCCVNERCMMCAFKEFGENPFVKKVEQF